MKSNNTEHIMDFREVTLYANQLSQAIEKHSSFLLLHNLSKEINEIHASASNWNEIASGLLPQKTSTRNKMKNEIIQTTYDDILSILSEPIARVIITPMHERLINILSQVDILRQKLINFLLPLEPSMNATSNFQSTEFIEKIHNDIKIIHDLHKTIELIPLDLQETRVLNWMNELFEWIASIPYPNDDPKKHAITTEFAQQKIEESLTIVGTIPGNVIETLCSLNVMNLDDTKGPVGFHPNIHTSLNLAGDFHDHLEKQIQHTKDFQSRVLYTLETRRPDIDVLKKLHEEMFTLLVLPTSQTRRMLEKALNKSASRVATGQRLRASEVSDALHSSSSEYSGNEDEEEEADAYWSDIQKNGAATDGSSGSSSRGKGLTSSSHKRNRDIVDSLADLNSSSTTIKRAHIKTEEKPTTSSKKQKLCANPDCPTKSNKLKSSSYCSNHCAITNAATALNSLLLYRKLLCIYGAMKNHTIQIKDPSNNLHKVSTADWNAFAINKPIAQIAMNDILLSLKNINYIAEVQQQSPRSGGSYNDTLETFLMEDSRRSAMLSTENTHNNETMSVNMNNIDKKTNYIQSMLLSLPPAAGAVLLKGDSEGQSIHSVAMKSVGSVTITPAQTSSDEDLRLKIRYGLEELLERSLTRLNVPGAVNHAAFIALEFEEELCMKYATAESKASGSGSGKKSSSSGLLVFDKKEYRKHYLMLISNLRKVHNDPLVSDAGN